MSDGTYGNVTMAKNQSEGAQIAQMGITKIYPENQMQTKNGAAPLQGNAGLKCQDWATCAMGTASSSMEIHPTTAHAAIVVQVRLATQPTKINVKCVHKVHFRSIQRICLCLDGYPR